MKDYTVTYPISSKDNLDSFKRQASYNGWVGVKMTKIEAGL